MSRRATPQKRTVTPDPIYHSRLVSMLINRILKEGKKNSCSENLISSNETN